MNRFFNSSKNCDIFALYEIYNSTFYMKYIESYFDYSLDEFFVFVRKVEQCRYKIG